MIYCVWYPSGGFGHFINAILTLRGQNFVRPQKSLTFSHSGDSHSLDLVVPKYQNECWPSGIEFCDDKNYCVLIDNGINNESSKFRNHFPNALVIKVCYSDYTWPVVARTMIDKAMSSSIEEQLGTEIWNSSESWACREKYFLYLRDHDLRHAWRKVHQHDQPTFEISVSDLYHSYRNCFKKLNEIAEIRVFEDLWVEWRKANAKYIDPIETAIEILEAVSTKHTKDLSHITDIWTQAVLYYFIWLKYKIEVPHNDFADFFTSTDQIQELIQ